MNPLTLLPIHVGDRRAQEMAAKMGKGHARGQIILVERVSVVELEQRPKGSHRVGGLGMLDFLGVPAVVFELLDVVDLEGLEEPEVHNAAGDVGGAVKVHDDGVAEERLLWLEFDGRRCQSCGDLHCYRAEGPPCAQLPCMSASRAVQAH
jgi:hypothetical protein